jgi:formylglycine-generating enzyme required for sulfatase activity
MAWAHTLLVLALLAALDQPRVGKAAEPVAISLLKPAPEVLVPAGTFRALQAPATAKNDGAPANTVKSDDRVGAFWLDENPVTNEEFRRFVSLQPRFRKGHISPLFADAGYLAHWAAPLELGKDALPRQPVVHVSWFAAKAYCQSIGKRLPTEREWEYAASASETLADARTDAATKERILAWYSKPSSRPLPEVGQSPKNYYGVRDLHGLVWEWVLDWNSTLVSSDSRSSGNKDTQAFCGAGALGFSDTNDYAAFMRRAFRSALTAEYTTQSLGFRCARDAHVPPA